MGRQLYYCNAALGKISKKALINAVKKLNGGNIDISNLDKVLGNLGIKLTDSEIEELLSYLPIDDDGLVALNKFMDKMKIIKENIDAQNLENFLKDMGIILTGEYQDLLKHLPIDALGKINKKNIMNAMQNLSGGNVNINNLENVLGNLGIKLTDSEIEELLNNLPVDADGMITLKKVMDNVKSIKENIDAQNLENFLKDMGITLTEEEYQDLLKHLPIDANGKVKLKNVMNALKNLSATGRVDLNKLMDNVKSIKENIDVQNLKNFLKDMGITLTEDEYQDLLKHLPADDKGKINKKNIMNAVKTLHGGNVNISNLDRVLENLGIKLTDQEIEELLNNLPVDADGKVALNKIMDNMKSIKKNVDVQNLENFLKNMGITLTEDGYQDLLKHLPIDDNGKVEKNRLMNCLKDLKGVKVDIHELKNVLRNLGMDLTDQQFQLLLTVIPFDHDGKVDLNKLIEFSKTIKDGVTSQMSASSDSKLKYKLKPLTKIPSTHIRGKDFQGFLQDHDGKQKERLTQGQLEAFLDAFECFEKDETGCIDSHGLQSSAAQLGIELTNQEIQDELEFADTDRDGKLNFSDFLTVLTDDDRFIQAVVPETDPNSDLVDSTGILLFEMLSKLVETSALPRKCMVDIVCYYRKKYNEAASRPLWRCYDAGGKKRRKSKRVSVTGQGTSTAAFADASRIAIMGEKDLLKFLEELKRCSPASDSPYAKIPIFPLFPNMDGTVVGKPFKELQRLGVLRKREPLHFFEDYFFHKRNWKAQAAPFKPLENSNWPEEIISVDHMIKKKRQWNVAEAACLQKPVKRATDAYHLGVALGHRKDMLNFWRKIRGGLQKNLERLNMN
ncbi:EF-hand calcium-binding domain-containing protein 3 [Phascolarctos cinereus]